MNTWKKTGAAILFASLAVIAAHFYWLSTLNGNEVFPEDIFLNEVENKVALVVVAHDDDAIGCAGTISELTRKGWQVHFLTFYGQWRKADNPVRKEEVKKVAAIQKLSSIHLIDFSIQKSDTVREPWRPIPYSQFNTYLQVDSLKEIITKYIQTYNPSVIFSLDNIIGGYGHPEHVCVSQSILDVCSDSSYNITSVQKIYQAVFTRTLNENILKNNPAFIAAKRVYQVEGSPIPTVEVDIYKSSYEKKQVMLAYHSQRRNLKKIWPYYHVYPHWVYFKLFNKEYFHVIDLDKSGVAKD